MVDAGTTHYLCLQCAIYALSMVVAQGTIVALLPGGGETVHGCAETWHEVASGNIYVHNTMIYIFIHVYYGKPWILTAEPASSNHGRRTKQLLQHSTDTPAHWHPVIFQSNENRKCAPYMRHMSEQVREDENECTCVYMHVHLCMHSYILGSTHKAST